MSDVVLVNPRIGIYTKVFRPFIPLGLLAISSYLVQDGYRVKIIDQHMSGNWEADLRRELQQRPLCVGITSMTGTQLHGAMRASRIVRDNGSIPIVWGGVHATLFPEETLSNPFIDFIVRGEGEWAFYQLVQAFRQNTPLDAVPNLSYMKAGQICHTPTVSFLDPNEIPPMPYHLLEVKKYLHTYFYEHDVIEIETSRGCPFACGFCYNQTFNRQIWRGLSAANIYHLICRLLDDYPLRSILVIDDSFLVNLKRVVELTDMILDHNLDINLGFQGRLSGILAMSDRELDRLVKAGTRFMQFGVESGSPRILTLINKNITVEDVIEVNKRLARYPGLYCFYNFMVGLPTETEDDLMRTVGLAWRLLEENPNTCIGTIHIYKEYPGTPLFEQALSEGYRPPQTLEEWVSYDWQSAVRRNKPEQLMKLIKRITVASYCLDDKIRMLGDSRLASLVAHAYRPVARFRFRHKFFRCMPEAKLFS